MDELTRSKLRLLCMTLGLFSYYHIELKKKERKIDTKSDSPDLEVALETGPLRAPMAP